MDQSPIFTAMLTFTAAPAFGTVLCTFLISECRQKTRCTLINEGIITDDSFASCPLLGMKHDVLRYWCSRIGVLAGVFATSFLILTAAVNVRLLLHLVFFSLSLFGMIVWSLTVSISLLPPTARPNILDRLTPFMISLTAVVMATNSLLTLTINHGRFYAAAILEYVTIGGQVLILLLLSYRFRQVDVYFGVPKAAFDIEETTSNSAQQAG